FVPAAAKQGLFGARRATRSGRHPAMGNADGLYPVVIQRKRIGTANRRNILIETLGQLVGGDLYAWLAPGHPDLFEKLAGVALLLAIIQIQGVQIQATPLRAL